MTGNSFFRCRIPFGAEHSHQAWGGRSDLESKILKANRCIDIIANKGFNYPSLLDRFEVRATDPNQGAHPMPIIYIESRINPTS